MGFQIFFFKIALKYQIVSSAAEQSQWSAADSVVCIADYWAEFIKVKRIHAILLYRMLYLKKNIQI